MMRMDSSNAAFRLGTSERLIGRISPFRWIEMALERRNHSMQR